MKYKDITKNKEINAYLEKGNANLGQLGFTDHSQAHCVQVAQQAGKILQRFGYSQREIELVKIAGYMHDIGNAINRTHHAEYGALLANDLPAEQGTPEGEVHLRYPRPRQLCRDGIEAEDCQGQIRHRAEPSD